jgi:hypothetical protein
VHRVVRDFQRGWNRVKGEENKSESGDKLSAWTVLSASRALPENVNYAVKSSFLLSFLESVPEVSAKLKEPNTKDRKLEDVVKSAEQAAVLVLAY